MQAVGLAGDRARGRHVVTPAVGQRVRVTVWRDRQPRFDVVERQQQVVDGHGGGDVAAVVCQLARDAGGPDIVGQLLLTPVTDTAPSWNSAGACAC